MRRIGQAAEREGIPCIVTPEDIDVSEARMAWVKLEVPLVPPGSNKLMRMHWATRKRLLNEWMLRILTGFIRNSPIEGQLKEWADSRSRLKVKIHVAHAQLFDQDNLYSAAKLPLDALVRLGFIADDSNKFIDLPVTQSRSKAKQTTISIYAPEKG